MELRPLAREEIALVWTIDRREVINHIYSLRDGALVLEPEHYDMQGWPPGEAETYTPLLLACYDRGGVFTGAFDGATLAGIGVVDTVCRGPQRDLLQLEFLHVSRPYRGRASAGGSSPTPRRSQRRAGRTASTSRPRHRSTP